MGIHVNDSGTWKLTSEVWVNDSGTWKLPAVFINDAGTWKAVSGIWDLGSAAYASKSLDVSGRVNANGPYGLFFNPDGTKMFVTDDSDAYPYILSTPWDISTATLGIGSKKLGLYTSSIFFNPDGTKMFYMDNVYPDSDIYQLALSTAWDITTATDTGKSKSLRPENDGRGHSLFFNPDGTKMYASEWSNKKVHQYTLSTPWDISTATYDSKSIDVSTEDGMPYGLFFNPDGTKMFVGGQANGAALQYTLSTPWDISTATYDSKSIDVSTEDGTPRDIFFNPDGTKMFVVGGANDKVYQYTL